MPLSPLCQVREGAGPWLSTANGVDVSSGAAVSIRLADTTGVVDWFLQIIGTDELTSAPVLVGVNILTHQVTSPGTAVTLTFPAAVGRALGFRSEVTGVGGPIVTTFGIYSLTTFSTRVGFVTETREGDSDYGWATKINPLIRSGGGGGGGGPDNYTLTDVEEEKTIPEGQTMLFEDDVIIEDGGSLIVLGEVTAIRTEDNFSMLLVPQRSERVVQENDEMLFTEDLEVDGQLTVDGQITDATPYDGDDILAALTAIAPNTPAILGVASPVSFLTPAQARTVMDVPSFSQMNTAIGSAGLTLDPVVHHASFTVLVNHTHYVWTSDALSKTVTLPTSPADGDRVEIIGLGGGWDLITIDNPIFPVTYNGSGNVSVAGDPFTFAGGNLHVLLVYRSAAATGFYAGWFNLSDSVTSQFGANGSPTTAGVIVTGGTNPGQVYAETIAPNSLIGRSDVDPIESVVIGDGELPFRPAGGSLGSFSQSALNPWTTVITSPGVHQLQSNKANLYVAVAGLTLQFPSANDGDELQIKEASAFAGTAPNSVTLDTNSPFIFVENIGVGGNTQTDTLTEYKTWIKYKYDASGPVWRIVGAAYQLP